MADFLNKQNQKQLQTCPFFLPANLNLGGLVTEKFISTRHADEFVFAAWM